MIGQKDQHPERSTATDAWNQNRNTYVFLFHAWAEVRDQGAKAREEADQRDSQPQGLHHQVQI